MPSGMEMMLKAMGLDPDELKSSVEGFMVHMKDQAAKINANQARIEVKLDEMRELVLDVVGPRPSTTHILENGEPTGVLVTSEKFPQAMIDDVNHRGAGNP